MRYMVSPVFDPAHHMESSPTLLSRLTFLKRLGWHDAGAERGGSRLESLVRKADVPKGEEEQFRD